MNTSDEVKVGYNDGLKVSQLNTFDVFTRNSNKTVQSSRMGNLTEVLRKNSPVHAQQSLIDLCKQFSDVFHFENDQPTVNNFYTQHLNLKDAEPVYTRNYRLRQTHRAEINNQVKKLLEDNLIELSLSYLTITLH